VVSFAALAAQACGEVTAAGDRQKNLCANGVCDDGGATGGGMGAGGRGGVGGSDAGIRTERVVLPCTVCRRAENCCKAEGLTDCNYTARCTSASLAEQMQFYLALCQTVLGASSARSKRPADVCGSH